MGNTAFPLLQQNDTATIYACDFSHHAIKLLKEHPLYHDQRIQADVADISSEMPFGFLGEAKVDLCTMVFVLSAIHPEKLPQVQHDTPAAVQSLLSCVKQSTCSSCLACRYQLCLSSA